MAFGDALQSGIQGASVGAAAGPWGAVAGGVAGLLGGIFGSKKEKASSAEAARLQQASIDAAIKSTKEGFDYNTNQFNQFSGDINKNLDPYQQAGQDALSQQRALAGLDGPEAQAQAQAGIQGGAQFGALAQQGENAILQNASATGGLRGGNTQGALAQFRPQLLQQLLEQQYSRLSGFSNQGLGATQQSQALGAGVAAPDYADLLLGRGRVGAGAALAGGKADQKQYAGIANFAGNVAGLDFSKAFGGGAPPPPNAIGNNLDLSFLRAGGG